MNKKKLYVFYFVSIIIIGSIGFYVIGGEDCSWIDDVYMTIITLTFIGFSEFYPLNDFGRILAIIVIVFGVGIINIPNFIGISIKETKLKDTYDPLIVCIKKHNSLNNLINLDSIYILGKDYSLLAIGDKAKLNNFSETQLLNNRT